MYNTKEGKSCVIYIRVSSECQVKGYSLDGQKHYLAECAERRGMTVLDTYVEEGKSGKSIEGRTEFQRMLDDIQSGKVHTDYVLVFKLSRFGRNARDVLNSLEFIMKYGVHLMCVEDGLDSSTSMGKMMITILGAVAELERENIIAQSLLGREEKAKSGGWNGGFAPYGYRLVKGDDKSKGKLETVPEEKTVVQLVFDMFLNRNMGYTAISGYLNRNGYTRPPAKNAIRPSYGEWSSDHIKRMLSNPVYTGRVAWGKRRTEKVPGRSRSNRPFRESARSRPRDYPPTRSDSAAPCGNNRSARRQKTPPDARQTPPIAATLAERQPYRPWKNSLRNARRTTEPSKPERQTG